MINIPKETWGLFLSNWEKGNAKPALNPHQTQKLCLILGISFDDLVKGFNEEAEITIK